MSDLIDRKKIQEYLDKYYEIENRCGGAYKDACCTVIGCIANTVMTMPAVEAKEVVMNNFERVKQLNEEQFTDWLMCNWENLKRTWSSTRSGMIEWLKSENYKPCDFCYEGCCSITTCEYLRKIDNTYANFEMKNNSRGFEV